MEIEPDSKCFTITWRIENYDFFLKTEDVYYLSPPFVIESLEDTTWNLVIMANFLENQEHVLFYVNRANLQKPEYRLDYEICFFGDDSSLFYKGYSHIDRDMDYSKDIGIPYDEFYIKKGNEFLRPQTLTIRCRTYKSEDSFANVEKCFIRTRVRVERKAFIGLLEKFSSLVPDEERILSTKSSSTEKHLLTLKLSLSGDLCCKERVWIEVMPVKEGYIKFCKCKFFLLDSEGTKTECGRGEIFFNEEEPQKWKFPLNFTKGHILKRNVHFLSNDTLALKCEFAFSTGIEYEEIEDSEISRIAIDDNSQPREFPSALEDMTRLYNEGILCDMKLQTETETFHVHKNILSARSSVFQTLFKTDMREKTTDCVNIEDLEADTVRRMLMFLYSDKLEDLDWESAKRLYFAADKYIIEALKCRCSDYIKRNLQLLNCCEILLLAHKYQDKDLKTNVHEYIASYNEEIFHSDQWKKLEFKNPEICLETFRAVFLRD